MRDEARAGPRRAHKEGKIDLLMLLHPSVEPRAAGTVEAGRELAAQSATGPPGKDRGASAVQDPSGNHPPIRRLSLPLK